ncbi:MAG: hypothetical protein J6T15_04740 [Bacilli bacterium]|nr:hypothetical protein [Bacilli bacterium]
MNFLGLDPSLSAFGIAIIDTDRKEIILDQFKSDDHHNFVFMCWAVKNLLNDFISKYSRYLSASLFIAQESPIASGINSGKLNALGFCFYSELGRISSYSRINTYLPLRLKQFHKKRGIKKYCKKDTMDVVEEILKEFESYGYTVNIVYSRTKKEVNITDGEADAFMYALKNFTDWSKDELSIKLKEKYPLDVFTSIEGGVYYDKG